MDAEKAFTAIAINSVTGNKELMKRYGAKSQEMPVSELETLNPLCSDPIGEGCTELAVGGLWSEPVCQHCFDHMHDCKGCKEAIPDQDEHGTLDYCAECAKELGVDQ